MSSVRLSRDLADQGYSYAEMARLARNAKLIRVRRGAYAPPPGPAPDPRAVHRQLIEATLGQSSTESVVSHQSAAVLHNLPIGNDQLNRVHLTRNREGQGKVRRYVHVHGLTLQDDDVVQVEGFPVTSLARTVLDIACSLPPLQAVPVGDAALRAGLLAQELATQLDRAGSRHGVAQARRTAMLLDARSESAGESMSKVVFVEHRIPKPQPQFEVFDRVGRLVARSDFGWKDEAPWVSLTAR